MTGRRKADSFPGGHGVFCTELSLAEERSLATLRPMTASIRLLCSLLLALVLLTQFFAKAGALPFPAEDGAAAAHSTLHWKNVDHHHHVDNSYHQDDASPASKHVHADNGTSNAAPFTAAVYVEAYFTSSAIPQSTSSSLRPAPFLEGLKRPPRSVA